MGYEIGQVATFQHREDADQGERKRYEKDGSNDEPFDDQIVARVAFRMFCGVTTDKGQSVHSSFRPQEA
jgi:hypothetical protein